MSELWLKEEIDILKTKYEICSTDEVSNLLNRNLSSVRQKANKLGLKKKNKEIEYISRKSVFADFDFFNIPNNINSYWAGFIAADGNIHKNTLKIQLTGTDIDHLSKFKKHINYTGKVKIADGRFIKKSYTKESCIITITNNNMCQKLYENFNIIPNKSLILKPPINLSFEDSISFIVGYIDGDGSIFFRKDRPKIPILKIVGTIKMLEWIKSILQKICFHDNNIKLYKNIYSYVLMGKNCRIILDYIYKNFGLPYMDRKWRKIYV